MRLFNDFSMLALFMSIITDINGCLFLSVTLYPVTSRT